MARLTDDELIETLGRQLPDLLERRPDLEPFIYNVFLKFLARKEEVAAVLSELREFRIETGQRFEQVDRHFDRVDQRFDRVDQRFEQVDQRFVGVDQRLDGLDQRVDSLTTEVREGFNTTNQRFD